MITVDPKNVSIGEFHGHLVNAVAPRPIALASTIDEDGNPNLAPFSFFNAFGSHPPTLIFSANLRVRNTTSKHTHENIKQTREVVINAVSYSIVRQVSLASTEYPRGVNEFEKAGFTMLPSERVKPFRVAESPVQFECKVIDVVEMGKEGGAPNLFICEILLMHISESVLDEKGRIDVNKIDLCGRLGGPRYVRASGSAVFEVPQPTTEIYIGMDNLPLSIRHSKILTGNDLARLASIVEIPVSDSSFQDEYLATLKSEEAVHQYAHELLQNGDVAKAWQVLLK